MKLEIENKVSTDIIFKCKILLNFSEECSTKGGTNDGTCASGFGVCCICKFIVIKFHICCIYYILILFHLYSLFCYGCVYYMKMLPVHFLILTIVNVKQYPKICPRLCPENMA